MVQNKVLIIDGQILQTDAWHRGMGKYMLQVLAQLSRQYNDSEMIVIFNSNIQTAQQRFDDIRYHCPNVRQVSVGLPVANNKRTTKTQYLQALNECIDNLGRKYDQVTYMLTSIFTFDVYAEYPEAATVKAVIFYDLIPFLHWKDLGGYFPPHLYMERFNTLYESDAILCISETTRNDVIDSFSIDPAKVINIGGGYTDHDFSAIKPSGFQLPQNYILFPTGNLPHKNNGNVFKAFKEVLKTHPELYLIVTSRFSEEAMEKLKKITKKNVIFSQNVSDEELEYLYKKSDLVIFASKYEGLGLPVLDAVHHGKPVVASRISVFEEMSTNAFYFFDPNNPRDTAEATVNALDSKKLSEKKKNYPAILQKYTWKSVGAKLISAIETAPVKTMSTAPSVVRTGTKKIAIVSTNPGIGSSMGRVSEGLFAHLKDSVRVSYFFDSCGRHYTELERPTYLDYVNGVEVYDITRLTPDMYRKFDQVFYLVDELALKYVMMQTVACLPGYILTDGSKNDTYIFKAASQCALGVNEVKYQTYAEKTKLASRIIDIIDSDVKKSEVRDVIKSHQSNRLKRDYLLKRLEK